MPSWAKTEKVNSVSPKAVIFDMDGVIIDSEPLWRKAEMECFSRINIILTDDMCRSTAGLRLMQVVEHWQLHFGFDAQLNQQLFDDVHARVVELILAEGKAFDGLHKLITHIHNKKIKLALASGSSYAIIHAVLKKFSMENVFQVLRSGDDEEYGKPHPQIFINTAKLLDVLPGDCLVIEDSINGVVAARAARMRVIAMPEHEVENNPVFGIADFRVKSLLEIIDLI